MVALQTGPFVPGSIPGDGGCNSITLWEGKAMRKYWSILLLLVFAGAPAVASAWTVFPSVIHVGKRPSSFVVKNPADVPLTFQISVLSWSQGDKGDVTSPTDDMVFFPKIVTVPASSERVVRVGMKQWTPSPVERTYRVYVTELKGSPEDGTTVVKLLLAQGFPLFVDPIANKPDASVDASLLHGELAVAISNPGNVSFMADSVSVVFKDSAGNATFAATPPGWWVLPGSAWKKALTIPTDACGKSQTAEVTVKTSASKKSRTKVLPIAAGMCGG
jgi:P pilus assembly chaperone PapD